MSLREVMKKKLAREQEEMEVGAEVPAADADEMTYNQDDVDALQAADQTVADANAEIASGEEADQLVEQMQEQIDANQEILDSGVEPTEAQVVQATERAHFFAWRGAKTDVAFEAIDFTHDGQRYELSTESFSYNNQSNREKLEQAQMVTEGIMDSIKKGVGNFVDRILAIIKSIWEWLKGVFSVKNKLSGALVKLKPAVKEAKEEMKNTPLEEAQEEHGALITAVYSCAITKFKLQAFSVMGAGKAAPVSKDFVRDFSLAPLMKISHVLKELISDISKTGNPAEVAKAISDHEDGNKEFLDVNNFKDSGDINFVLYNIDKIYDVAQDDLKNGERATKAFTDAVGSYVKAGAEKSEPAMKLMTKRLQDVLRLNQEILKLGQALAKEMKKYAEDARAENKAKNQAIADKKAAEEKAAKLKPLDDAQKAARRAYLKEKTGYVDKSK